MHDKGLQLANIPMNGMETNELRILIGSEHYWKVVTGRIERVNDTLVLLESKIWLAHTGKYSHQDKCVRISRC